MGSDPRAPKGRRPEVRASLVDSGWSLAPPSSSEGGGHDDEITHAGQQRTATGARPSPVARGGRARPLDSTDEDALFDRVLGNVGDQPSWERGAPPPLPPPPPPPRRPARPSQAPPPPAHVFSAVPVPPTSAIDSFMEELPTAPSASAYKPSPPPVPDVAATAPLGTRVDEPRLPVLPEPEATPTVAREKRSGMPLWMILIGGLAIVAGVAAAFVMVLSKSQPDVFASLLKSIPWLSSPSPAAPPATQRAEQTRADPAPSAALPSPPASAPEPQQPADPAAAAANPLAVVSGDPEAVASLEKKAELTPEEALALHHGRAARALGEVRALGEELAKSSAAPAGESLAKLRAYAQDPRTAGEALAAMARLQGPAGPDLLYEVWTGTPKRNDSTTLAEALLRHPNLRARAAKPLAVALELRSATECDAVKALLPRITEQGDRRSLVPLAKLTTRRGCGPNKKQDCWACLRDDKGKAIADAMKAVRGRPEPKY